MSLYTFNCQSLRAHVQDLQLDRVALSSNFLILSETWMNEEDPAIGIPNFDIVVRFKRAETRAGGVAIYRNINDRAHVVTPQTELNARQMQSLSINLSKVGEICACESSLENGKTVIIVAIYVSPNQSINDIIEYIRETLVKYTPDVSRILQKNYHEIPMILSGDFNVNFTLDTALPLIKFLNDKFQLKMCSSRTESTTRSKTTIDAVFQRHINQIETKAFVSYFRYHN